jgi:hypothetical protein
MISLEKIIKITHHNSMKYKILSKVCNLKFINYDIK